MLLHGQILFYFFKLHFIYFYLPKILQVKSYRFSAETIKIWTKPIWSTSPLLITIQKAITVTVRLEFTSTTVHVCARVPPRAPVINKYNLSAVCPWDGHISPPLPAIMSLLPSSGSPGSFLSPTPNTHMHTQTHTHHTYSSLHPSLNSSFLFIPLSDADTCW